MMFGLRLMVALVDGWCPGETRTRPESSCASLAVGGFAAVFLVGAG